MPDATEPVESIPYMCNNCYEAEADGPFGFCSRRCKGEKFRRNREQCATDPCAFLDEEEIERNDLLYFAVRPSEFRARYGFSLRELYSYFQKSEHAIAYYGLK